MKPIQLDMVSDPEIPIDQLEVEEVRWLRTGELRRMLLDGVVEDGFTLPAIFVSRSSPSSTADLLELATVGAAGRIVVGFCGQLVEQDDFGLLIVRDARVSVDSQIGPCPGCVFGEELAFCGH